jgi:hypothetical protein
MVFDQCWELPSGTPAGGFYSLQQGVDGYALEEEIVDLIGRKEVDEHVSGNKETWIDEQSELGDMVSWFLVALVV